MNKENYYSTRDFNLSQFLFAKGFELVNLDWTDSRRCKFVFVNSPEIEDSVELFNYAKESDPRVMVDARKLLLSSKFLKDKLYQGRD